jgi:hypothetical protein
MYLENVKYGRPLKPPQMSQELSKLTSQENFIDLASAKKNRSLNGQFVLLTWFTKVSCHGTRKVTLVSYISQSKKLK